MAGYVRLWLVLCVIIAVLSAGAALNWITIAQSLVFSADAVGSSVFWNAYLRFQFWAFLSFFAVLVGLVSMGVTVLVGKRS